MAEKPETDKASERYKDSLNLPKTDFPMRGNLPETEPSTIAFWKANKIYEKMVARNTKREKFVMPDGPPYANGNIHIGHVLNKVLKDIVIKYKNLSGRPAHFIPGWDCHGLPIEHKVTKDLGPKRKDKTDKDIRELCRQEARKWVNTQREQFIRLGILADWAHPYLTIDPSYEAEEVREIGRVLKNGILYRGEKPVYWCWALQTALAEAEVEYAQHRSPSIYVKFDVTDAKKIDLPKNTSFVIWTTTPWTLPANLAIAVNKDFEYGVFKHEREHIVIAAELKEAFEKATGWALEKIKTFRGSELEGILTKHPFIDRPSPVVFGHHVSLEAGTGNVHIAPGHGQDDYQVGLQYGLKVYSPVDEAGCFTDEVPEYKGQQIFAVNPLIVERLKSSGHLIHYSEFEHSYPHCWRSKTPLIFRATPQWFLRVDDENFNVRQKALQALDEIRFVPKWGEARLRAMIENRPDWCLSRQRAWGVPIPVFYCQSCGTELINQDVIERVAAAMEKNDGIEAYFEGDTKQFVQGHKCAKCGGSEFTKGKDILDVWFDSGVCHAAVQSRREGMASPADIYLEGSDQHRGWFQTSLLSSIASTGKAPFKALVTHGFVNDAKGRKMSKSLGNVVDPKEWIQKSGAEILRLFAAYEDYGQDLSCGPENFTRITESYRRFRNTMRFLLGNLEGFDPQKDQVAYDRMMALDRWALHRLNALTEKITEAYENYEFYKVYHALNHFMTVDLSATYLDILKDRLYTWRKDGEERRSAQTVLYHLVHRLCSLMAPILSFLSEETYKHIHGKKEESIFLVPFPKADENWNDPNLEQDFAGLLDVRSDVLKKIEELRVQKIVRSSLEAKVSLTAAGGQFELLKKYEKHLPEYFIVSDVEIREGKYAATVGKASGEKCERCWNYRDTVGRDGRFPGACLKCVEALL